MLKRAVISFHDTSPFYQKEVEQVLDLIPHNKSFLITPFWHRKYKLNKDFISRLGNEDLVLHGLLHKSDHFDPLSILYLNKDLSREFLYLDYSATKEKIITGLKIMEESFGLIPKGFIPPMWYHNSHLLKVLTELNFEYTETWTSFISLNNKYKLSSYPISLDYGKNLLLSKIYLNCWRSYFKFNKPELIRIAIHPSDIRNGLLNNIIKIIDELENEGYSFVTYNQLIKRTNV